MFILKDEKQIERAVTKARTIKPRVRIIGFGLYEVRGSKGNAYLVRCKRDNRGYKTVGCNCEGGSKGFVCYHAAAAIGIHVVMAESKMSH